MKSLPTEYLPVIPIRQMVIFPGIAVPVRASRAKSMAALEEANTRGSPILLVSVKDEQGEEFKPAHLYKVGTLCKLERVRGNKEVGYQAIVRGVSRFQITEFLEQDNMINAQGRVLADEMDLDASTQAALLGSMKSLAKDILQFLPGNAGQFSELLSGIEIFPFS